MIAFIRRWIALLTIIGGVVLIYFEAHDYRGGDSWFWIGVAVLAIVLGIFELLSPKNPRR